MKKEITVAIITRDRANYLKRCLNTLSKQTTKPKQVIVIDNASNDFTQATIYQFKKVLPIKYIYEKKVGIPYARNRALKECKTKLLAFIDDDCEAESNWLENILKAFNKYPQAAAIQGRAISLPRNGFFAILAEHYFDMWIEQNRLDNQTISIIDTKTVIFNTHLLKKFKIKFDTNLIRGSDIDIAKQLIYKNQKIYYYPEITVKHWERDGLISYLKQRYKISQSHPYLQLKWPDQFNTQTTNQREIYARTVENINIKLNFKQKVLFKFVLKISAYLREKAYREVYKGINLKIMRPSVSNSDKITVAVATRNRSVYLKECLLSLCQQTVRPKEVLVIDNGSTDFTPDVVKEFKNILPFRYLYEGQVGITYAKSKALKECKTKLLAFIDDDCEAESNWLENILKAFNKYPQAAAIQGRAVGLPYRGIISEICEWDYQNWFCSYLLPDNSINIIDGKNVCLNTNFLKKYNLKFDHYFSLYNCADDLDLAFQILSCNGSIYYEETILVKSWWRNSLKDFIKHRLSKGAGRAILNYKWNLDIYDSYKKQGLFKKSDFHPSSRLVKTFFPLISLILKVGFNFGLHLESIKIHYFHIKNQRLLDLRALNLAVNIVGFYKKSRKPLLEKFFRKVFWQFVAYLSLLEIKNPRFIGYPQRKNPTLNLAKGLVVILKTKDELNLYFCLKSLFTQTLQPVQIYLLSNNKVKTFKVIKLFNNLQFFEEEMILDNKQIKIISFIDDDCEAESNWLENILKAFNKYPQAAAIQGKIAYPNNFSFYQNFLKNFEDYLQFKNSKEQTTMLLGRHNFHLNLKKLRYKIYNLSADIVDRYTLSALLSKWGFVIYLDQDIVVKVKDQGSFFTFLKLWFDEGRFFIRVQAYLLLPAIFYPHQLIKEKSSSFYVVKIIERYIKSYTSILNSGKHLLKVTVVAFSVMLWGVVFLRPLIFFSYWFFRLGSFIEQLNFFHNFIRLNNRLPVHNLKKSKYNSLSVLVITKNRRSKLLRVLASLARQTRKADQIVIVDSSDEPVDKFIETFKTKLPIDYYYEKRLGFGIARSTGLKQAKFSIVATIDDDETAPRNWCENVLKSHHDYPSAVAIQGRVISKGNTLQSKIEQIRMDDWFLKNLDNLSRIKIISTKNVSFKRALFIKNQLDFNSLEDYGKFGAEDIDLARQINKLGLTIQYDPKVITYHWERESLVSYLKQQYRKGRSSVLINKTWDSQSLTLPLRSPLPINLRPIVNLITHPEIKNPLSLVGLGFYYLLSLAVYRYGANQGERKTVQEELYNPKQITIANTQAINLSVGIITHNRAKGLYRLLTSLARQSFLPTEILVVDNSSQDDTVEVIKQFKKVLPIKYIYEKKVGIPYARNRALKECKTKLLAFIDDDCEAESNWLENILKAFNKYPQAAAIQGYSISMPKGGAISTVVQFNRNSTIKNYLLADKKSFQRSIYDNSDIGFRYLRCDTRNLLLNLDKVKHLNLTFNEQFLRGSDTEFGLQLLSAGEQIIFCSFFKVKHWERPNISSFLKQSQLQGLTSNLITKKWPSEYNTFKTKNNLIKTGAFVYYCIINQQWLKLPKLLAIFFLYQRSFKQGKLGKLVLDN